MGYPMMGIDVPPFALSRLAINGTRPSEMYLRQTDWWQG